MHPNCLPGYTQSLGSSPGINSFYFCTPVTEPLILDCLSGSQIDATRTPQLLYLDDGKHFWKGILGGGHRRQEAEENNSWRVECAPPVTESHPPSQLSHFLWHCGLLLSSIEVSLNYKAVSTSHTEAGFCSTDLEVELSSFTGRTVNAVLK